MTIINMPPAGYLPRDSVTVENAEAPPVNRLGIVCPKKCSRNPPKFAMEPYISCID